MKPALLKSVHLPTLLADVLVPFCCYKLLRHPGIVTRHGLSDTAALVWVAVVPGGKVAFDWLRSRRIDVVGCVVVWEIVLAVTLAVCFHSPRLILLKGPAQVAVLALACFGSLLIKMPLAEYAAQLFGSGSVHFGGEGIAHFKAAPRERLRHVTLVWGVVSLADAVARSGLIFTLPIDAYLLVSRVLQTIYFAALGVWTFRYLRVEK